MGVGVFCVTVLSLRDGPSFFFLRAVCWLSMKVFLWRVRFWLRMNAGGVLNTCKSNGIPGSLLPG